MSQAAEKIADSDKELTSYRRYRVVIVSSSGMKCFLPYLNSDDFDLAGIVDMSLPMGGATTTTLDRIIDFMRKMRTLKCRLRFNSLIRKRNCSFFQYHIDQNDMLEQRLRELEPDIVIVYRLGLLKPHVLSIPKVGIINIHPSMLPKYRGGQPLLWMAKNFDLSGGVTVHFMDEKADTGPILGQASFSINSGMTEEEIEHQAIHEVGIPLSLRVVRELAQGKSSPVSQQTTSPTEYAYLRNPEQMWQMMDWDTWSLEHTWHMLRHKPFWKERLPDAKGWRRWVVWKIGKFIPEFHDAAPGQVLSVVGGYAISHKEGWIKIKPVLHIPLIIKRLMKVVLR
jgi:methionyl-tRNA formyltransferase